MPKLRLAFPSGRGLDRATGALAIDARAAADLRNVLLHEGKVIVRPALGAPVATIAGEPVCHLHYARSLAALIYVTWTGTAVKVYAADLGGMNPALVGTWATLPAGAVEPPRFSSAESFSLLFLAHDEPSVTKRLVTQVYDGSTLADLTADLDNTTAKDVLFRGVEAIGAYLWGWGFGSDSDKARPEVVRVSKPGDPATWEGNSYLLAGARNDAVLGCRSCVRGVTVLKGSRRYLITGTDKRTFGFDAFEDATHGVAAQRLAVTVGGMVYAWTHEGPRVSDGGAYVPLEIPLELFAALPDGLPTGSRLEMGWALHDATVNAVRFYFPDPVDCCTLAFTLSLQQGPAAPPAWAYDHYPRVLLHGCVVAPSSETSTVEPGFADAVTGSGVQTGSTFQMKINVTHNSYLGDETIEVWARQGASAYAIVHTTAIVTSAATQDMQFALPAAGSWDIAVRYTRGGAPRVDHAFADPTSWPATALVTATLTALPILSPNPAVYTPGATTAAGTWAGSWNAPASGAVVAVFFRGRDDFGLFGEVAGGGGLSAVDATSKTGMAASGIAGRFVRYQVTQRLTVNGIVGTSLLSGFSSEVFFGLAEAPTFPVAPFIGAQYSAGSGTVVFLDFIESPAVGSASAGESEVASTVDNVASVLAQVTGIALGSSFVQITAPVAVDCATRGVGSTVRWLGAAVRHRLTIAGVEQYTHWGGTSIIVSGICQL